MVDIRAAAFGKRNTCCMRGLGFFRPLKMDLDKIQHWTFTVFPTADLRGVVGQKNEQNTSDSSGSPGSRMPTEPAPSPAHAPLIGLL